MENGNINTTYSLKLEMLSPVHVGAGKEKDLIKGIDFFIQKGDICVIDKEKLLLKLIDLALLDKYTELVSKAKADDILDFVNRANIRLTDITIYTYPYSDQPAGEIKSFIRTGMGNPIIPGSSIKGAIRSILFNYLYKTVKPQSNFNYLEKDLFGSIDNNLMKFIRVYDAEFTNKDVELSTIELFNLYKKGIWQSDLKKQFRISLESLSMEAQSTFKFSIATELSKFIKAKKTDLLPKYLHLIVKDNNPIENIFTILNTYTKLYIAKEIEFFEKYNQLDNTDTLIAFYNEVLENCKSKNSCVFRMSYGSGFHGITGDWRLPDHLDTIESPDNENWVWNSFLKKRAPAHYKSRRIITDYENEYLPLGFVKLTKSE